jgi:hypothetical protein
MLSDSHLEIEKRGSHWRLSARGFPALAIVLALVAVALLMLPISGRIFDFH